MTWQHKQVPFKVIFPGLGIVHITCRDKKTALYPKHTCTYKNIFLKIIRIFCFFKSTRFLKIKNSMQTEQKKSKIAWKNTAFKNIASFLCVFLKKLFKCVFLHRKKEESFFIVYVFCLSSYHRSLFDLIRFEFLFLLNTI